MRVPVPVLRRMMVRAKCLMGFDLGLASSAFDSVTGATGRDWLSATDSATATASRSTTGSTTG
jgi:hypothetical protein